LNTRGTWTESRIWKYRTHNTKLLVDVHYVLYMIYVLKVEHFMIDYIQLS